MQLHGEIQALSESEVIEIFLVYFILIKVIFRFPMIWLRKSSLDRSTTPRRERVRSRLPIRTALAKVALKFVEFFISNFCCYFLALPHLSPPSQPKLSPSCWKTRGSISHWSTNSKHARLTGLPSATSHHLSKFIEPFSFYCQGRQRDKCSECAGVWRGGIWGSGEVLQG